MAAVILALDVEGLTRWDYRAVVEQVEQSGRFVDRWNIPFSPEVRPGTEAWLMLRGKNDAGSGLIGHGLVVSEPCQAVVGGDSDAIGWFVTLAFDALLPVGDQVGLPALDTALAGGLGADAGVLSLVTVPASSEPELRRLWREHGPTTADPAEVVGGTFPPGAVRNIQVNRYERDPDARRMCLAFHGTSCAVCGFSFEATYGETDTGVVAVHHVVPPGMLGGDYQLDPVADLVPLCRNCHAMAHAGANPPRTVSELRNIISASGHVKGEVVGKPALQAQEDARRILEGGQA